MLEVGNFDGDAAAVFMESRTHFGAWCIVSSPLILGLDLTDENKVDSVWDIISNTEAIAVSLIAHTYLCQHILPVRTP
jgi:alpha-galactosidase